jgi:hypothetical protein
MAKTFDNISDASATNYLFLFAQRTLALQNEPPPPPPLNALGLPCHAVCLLWARLYPKKAADHKYLSAFLSFLATWGVATSKNVIAERAAVTCGEDDGGDGGEDESGEDEGEGEAGDSEAGEGEDEGGGTLEAATVKKAADKLAHSSAREDGQVKDKDQDQEKTLAQKIAPLAGKITEYINDHQDDAAQEERWRTNMKRDTMKGFKKQREAINKQREAIRNEVREAIDKQREAIRNEVREAIDKQREAIDKQREAIDKQYEAIAKVHQLIMELSTPTPTPIATADTY